jgi:hypothetical protein
MVAGVHGRVEAARLRGNRKTLLFNENLCACRRTVHGAVNGDYQ